jgi:diaminopimelate epimerase
MKFQKYHALGNDYLVLDPQDAQLPNERDIRLICHRNYGLGSDGILYGPLPTEKADFGLRILNPDGSEAEKSGNGLRIFCRYLYDSERVQLGLDFTIDTPGGVVTCKILDPRTEIRVEMGQVSFDSRVIPVNIEGQPREILNEPVQLKAGSFDIYAATIGNPHCVVPLRDISEALAREIGPELETHPMFPNRTNVQLLKVLDRDTIQIEIWERGAGYTLASGSSSSASAAVARKMGAVDENITVKSPGGQLQITVHDDYSIDMTGPVTPVGTFHLTPDALQNPLVQ